MLYNESSFTRAADTRADILREAFDGLMQTLQRPAKIQQVSEMLGRIHLIPHMPKSSVKIPSIQPSLIILAHPEAMQQPGIPHHNQQYKPTVYMAPPGIELTFVSVVKPLGALGTAAALLGMNKKTPSGDVLTFNIDSTDLFGADGDELLLSSKGRKTRFVSALVPRPAIVFGDRNKTSSTLLLPPVSPGLLPGVAYNHAYGYWVHINQIQTGSNIQDPDKAMDDIAATISLIEQSGTKIS